MFLTFTPSAFQNLVSSDRWPEFEGAVTNYGSPKMDAELTNPNGRKPCPHCGKLITAKVLKRHIDSVHGNVLYRCNLVGCNFTSSRKDHLQKHTRKHFNTL